MSADAIIRNGWDRKRLADVCDFIMGQSPSSETYNETGDGLPFFQGKTDFGSKYPSLRMYCSDPKKVVEPGDILISVRAPVGPVNIANQRSCVGRGLAGLRAREGVLDQIFLYFELILNEKNIASLGTGSIFQSINKSQLENFELLLPELSEQKSIARTLTTIQDAIAGQENLIAKLKELKRNMMQYLFTHGTKGEKTKMTEIGEIPESWEVIEVGSIYEFTKKPRDMVLEGDVPFIPMENIPIGSIFVSDFIGKPANTITSGTYVENGNLLLAKITPSFENGKQAILKISNNFAYATTEVIPINGVEGKGQIMYLFYYLLKDDIRTRLAGKMEGTTGRQRLNKSVIEKTLIPCPSFEEQGRIADVLVAIDYKIGAIQEKVAEHQNLFKTLLHELMSGERRISTKV